MKNNTTARNVVARDKAEGFFTRNYGLRYGVVFALAGSIVSLGVAKPVKAENVMLYSTSFEQPTFQDGDQLLGFDGWSLAIPPFLNPEAAKITSDVASNRKQSVEILGADLISSPINPETDVQFTEPYDAVGSYRKPLGPEGLGQEISADQSRVHVDADLLLETNQPATPDEFFSLTIAARSGEGETLGEVGLSSQGVVEAFPFDADPGTAPAFVEPIRFNRWYHISMLLDYENRTTSYYIDGYLIGTVDAPSLSNILSRTAFVVYARPDTEDSVRSNYTARFDKLRVRVNSAHAEEAVEKH